MFARTERLFLRPGWVEDAPALQHAIAHENVAKMLVRLPWPYSQDDAEVFLSSISPSSPADFLIFERTQADPKLVGGIGLIFDAETAELGYWITPDAWGRGYVTEAGRAVVANAKHSMKLNRLTSGHFSDNPASGKVLEKLGFTPTGAVEDRYSLARDTQVPCVLYEQKLN